jgi:hypothetical protein
VAFTDLNGDGKFHFKKDTLIAGVVDEDKSGDASVGDTVRWGDSIPDPSGSQVAAFLDNESTITAVDFGPDGFTVTVVEEGEEGTVLWGANANAEVFATNFVPATQDVFLWDVINPGAYEDPILVQDSVIVTHGAGPGDPSTPDEANIFAQSPQAGDQGWLDIALV